MNNTSIYTADRIFTGISWLEQHAIIVENGKINTLIPVAELSSTHRVEQHDGCFIAPAFIDLQIYGANGKLLAVYPTTDALTDLVAYCKNGGAAFCLPTIATNTYETFYKCIDAIKEYWNKDGKGVLGLHIEGPWINPVKRGAHVETLIHKPELEEVKELLDYGNGVIKMITLAPEICEKDVIDLILSYGIIISAGHSNASYEEAKRGFANGITATTHLFNAMSRLHHREPGLVGAAMGDEKVMASIIPDGFHVDFAAIRIAYKAMGTRLFAITDAVTETNRGSYQHYPAGNKYEAGGILSGSALTMNKALKNLVEFAQIELADALRMCSLYPAKVMGIDNTFGKIESGFNSSIVVITNELDLV